MANDLKAVAAVEKKNREEAYAAKLSQFVDALGSLDTILETKQTVMDKCTKFVSEYLDIPAAYVAVCRNISGTDVLYYVSSNPSQASVIKGKKLQRPVEDGEESQSRQGISFDAFKIPDIIEETNDNDDDDSQKQTKESPKPVPLVVENVMRNNRVKFFGIPKLGAFAAIPLSMQSIDHENGCISASGDLHRGPHSMNKISTPLLFCMDTIGKYRTIEVS